MWLQWRWPPTVFLTYRLVLGVSVLGYTIFSLAVDFNGKHFIYMTNQAFIIQAIAFTVAAIVAVKGFIAKGKNKINPAEETQGGSPAAASSPFQWQTLDVEGGKTGGNTGGETGGETGGKTGVDGGKERTEKQLPWYDQLSWLLSATADNVALVVTLTYWGALFPLSDGSVDYDSIIKHAINAVIVLIDNAVSARPTRLLHCVYAVAYGLAYTVFSLIYWGVDNSNVIYSILDWNSPGLAVGIVLGLALVVVPLLSFFLFGIYRLRLLVYEKIYGEPY